MTEVAYDHDLAEQIVHYGVLAADMEAMKPPPVSKIRNPDGSAQRETSAEYTRRIISRAVLQLIEVGLLVIPDDARDKMESGIPLGPF